jgi:hypothetical protein
MAIYTFGGPLVSHLDGTVELKVASGFIGVGESGDFTVAEYNLLSPKYDLRSGVVANLKSNPVFRKPFR